MNAYSANELEPVRIRAIVFAPEMKASRLILYVISVLQHLATIYCYHELRILGYDTDNRTRSGYGQIYRQGQWHSLCDHGWGDNDALVFCRYLGYDRGIPFHILDNDPDVPEDPIWREEISCSSEEESLDQCTTRSVSKRCEPAGVTCDKRDPQLQDGSLRLSDGPTSYSGRVDVAYKGLWGSICDRLWDETTAGVVCSMLGYQEGGMAVKHSSFGHARQVFLDAVRCTGGHETDIRQCMSRPYLDQFCKLQRTAGVICLQKSAQNLTGQVRLTHGRHPGEGVVEINYYGIWGGICSDVWDKTNTRVLCGQLGYETGRKITAILQRKMKPTWLNYVHCDGNVTSLLDCELSKWEYLPCDPERVLRIECYNKDLALQNQDYSTNTTIMLNYGLPSGFVLLGLAVLAAILCRKHHRQRSRFLDDNVVHKDSVRSTRNPAYRLDMTLSSSSSIQQHPLTTTSSGIYNYIIDEDKYLDLIDDEKREAKLEPRSGVPLPVLPRYDDDNYLRPVNDSDVINRQRNDERAMMRR